MIGEDRNHLIKHGRCAEPRHRWDNTDGSHYGVYRSLSVSPRGGVAYADWQWSGGVGARHHAGVHVSATADGRACAVLLPWDGAAFGVANSPDDMPTVQ